MLKISPLVSIAWQFAAIEAANKASEFIEKEHICIGIFSLDKIFENKYIIKKLGPHRNELEKEYAILDDIIMSFGISMTLLRRGIRDVLSKGDYEHNDKENIVHRSKECKRHFQQTAELSNGEVNYLSLLASIFECPGESINRVLKDFGVELETFREKLLVSSIYIKEEPVKENLSFFSSQRVCKFLHDLRIEINGSNTINCALLHSHLPFIEKILLHNCSKMPSESLTLRIGLGLYFNRVIDVPSIPPLTAFTIEKPDLKIDSQVFESQIKAAGEVLKVFINDSLVIEKEIKILAQNEWSLEEFSYHRTSLASFVLPEHPAIEQITADLRSSLKPNKFINQTSLSETLNIIYDYFQRNWDIVYVDEPCSFEKKFQKMRLPHQVLLDWDSKKGKGTCIDLALLFASCLENLGFYPVLLMFEIKSGLWHTIVGCWKKRRVTFEPLITKKTIIEKELELIEQTGFAKGFVTKNNEPIKLTFEESCQKASKTFGEKKFIFALDIGAARKCKILPLPFAGRPQESAVVRNTYKKTRELAEEIGELTGYKVYTCPHILLALLLVGDGFTRKVFEEAGLDLDKSKAILLKGIKKVKLENKMEKPKPGPHFEPLRIQAEILAKQEGSPVILEKHLLFALLGTKSAALDKAIKTLETCREILKESAYLTLETCPLSRIEQSSLFGTVDSFE